MEIKVILLAILDFPLSRLLHQKICRGLKGPAEELSGLRGEGFPKHNLLQNESVVRFNSIERNKFWDK